MDGGALRNGYLGIIERSYRHSGESKTENRVYGIIELQYPPSWTLYLYV